MDPAPAGLLLVLCAGVAGLLAAERAGRTAWALPAKGTASAAFVALGWTADAPAWVLAALGLSLVGDVLLVPQDRRAFRGGILAFLLAHVAYVAAFLARGVDAAWAAAAGLVLLPAGLLVLRRLWPGVPVPLRGPVVAYVAVITLMVATAAGTRAPALLLAAAFFWANDLLVARDRFVEKAFWHRALGLPAYYAAQVLFALNA